MAIGFRVRVMVSVALGIGIGPLPSGTIVVSSGSSFSSASGNSSTDIVLTPNSIWLGLGFRVRVRFRPLTILYFCCIIRRFFLFSCQFFDHSHRSEPLQRGVMVRVMVKDNQVLPLWSTEIYVLNSCNYLW